MRRSLPLTLVCVLLTLLCGAVPAFAAGHHSTTQTSTTRHTRTSATSHTTTAKARTRATSGAASHVSYATGEKVLNDCQQHGQFTHDWTHAELEKALSMSSAMTNQYSTCSSDLHRALANGILVRNESGGGGGGSGSTIVIIVVAVLVVLAALLGVVAMRRRRQGGTPPPSAA